MWVERKPGWRVGWDSARPDRVPDVLGNFLKALRGEAQSLEGQSTGQLWPYPGPPAKGTVFIVLLLPNVTPPKAGFSKIP